MLIGEKRGKPQLLMAAGVAAYVLIRSIGAWSAESPVPTVTDPNIGTQRPPEMQIGALQGMGQVMNSCFNFTGQMNQIASALQGGGSGGDACSGDISFASGNSCEDFKSDGKLDLGLFTSRQLQLDAVIASLNSCKSTLTSARERVACLQTQANVLSNQVSDLQQAFQQNLQRMQQDVAQIKAAEADRKMQFEDVQKKLGGDKDSGKMGLLELKKKTQELVNSVMPGEILKAKETLKDLDNMKKGLEEQTVARKMSMTEECFSKRASPKLRCEPNGPPVSVRDYVLCRYEQSQYLVDAGEGEAPQVNRDNATLKKAAANRVSLQSVLDSIFASSSKISQVDPQKPDSMAKALTTTTTISSVQDIEQQYGSQLKGFDAKGFPIHDYVISQLKGCYSRAEKTVVLERKKVSSPIGAAEENFKKRERETVTQMQTMLERYSQQFSDNLSGLTGMHMPLNTATCKGSAPPVQVTCLEDLKANMEGMLNGNIPQSTMQLVIKGTKQETQIPFTCQGISGCVTKMQNLASDLKREHERIKQFKSDYVLKATQSVNNFASAMAKQLSPQSAALQKAMDDLNQMLASVGANPVRLKTIEGEQLEKDEDGLPKMPKNIMGLIGAQMSPAMLDLKGRAFEEGLRGLAERSRELDKKSGAAMAAKAKLAPLATKCQNDSLKDSLDQMKTLAAQITDCKAEADCRDSLEDGSLDSLYDTMSTISTSLGSALSPTARSISTAINKGRDNCKTTVDLADKIKKLEVERNRLSGDALKDWDKHNAWDDLVSKKSKWSETKCTAISDLKDAVESFSARRGGDSDSSSSSARDD